MGAVGRDRHLEVGEDGADVTLKAHVDHTVSLVQSQVATDVQADHLLLQQIHEAPRGGHHHVHTTGDEGETEIRGTCSVLLRGRHSALLRPLASFLSLLTSPLLITPTTLPYVEHTSPEGGCSLLDQ